MTNLYAVAQDYRAVQDLDDVSPEIIADTLAGIVAEFEDKAVALVKVTRNIESDIAQIDAEIKRLRELKDRREGVIDALRSYLKKNMAECGITKIEHALGGITLTKPRAIAVIDDERVIPDKYVRVETVIKPDKAKILADLKTGVDIPGARLGESDYGLTFK